MSVLQNMPVSSGFVESSSVQKNHELTIAEKDCVLTTSEEDMDDLNAFVDEKFQILSAGFGAACWRRECECGGDAQWKSSSC